MLIGRRERRRPLRCRLPVAACAAGECPALCFIVIDRGPLTPEEPEYLPIAAQRHVPILIVGETARRE